MHVLCDSNINFGSLLNLNPAIQRAFCRWIWFSTQTRRERQQYPMFRQTSQQPGEMMMVVIVMMVRRTMMITIVIMKMVIIIMIMLVMSSLWFYILCFCNLYFRSSTIDMDCSILYGTEYPVLWMKIGVLGSSIHPPIFTHILFPRLIFKTNMKIGVLGSSIHPFSHIFSMSSNRPL